MGKTVSSNTKKLNTKRHVYYITRFEDKVYGHGLKDPYKANGKLDKQEIVGNILPDQERKNGKTDIHFILTLPNKNGKDPSDLEYHEYTETFLNKYYPDAKGYYTMSKHKGDTHKHVHCIISPEKTTEGRHLYNKATLRDIPKWRSQYSLEHGFDAPKLAKEKWFKQNYKALENKLKNEPKLKEKTGGMTLLSFESALYAESKRFKETGIPKYNIDDLKQGHERTRSYGKHSPAFERLDERCKTHLSEIEKTYAMNEKNNNWGSFYAGFEKSNNQQHFLLNNTEKLKSFNSSDLSDDNKKKYYEMIERTNIFIRNENERRQMATLNKNIDKQQEIKDLRNEILTYQQTKGSYSDDTYLPSQRILKERGRLESWEKHATALKKEGLEDKQVDGWLKVYRDTVDKHDLKQENNRKDLPDRSNQDKGRDDDFDRGR